MWFSRRQLPPGGRQSAAGLSASIPTQLRDQRTDRARYGRETLLTYSFNAMLGVRS
jgi:hypothetical protein